MTTEEERAALYRNQQKQRRAWERANAALLAGNAAAAKALYDRTKAVRKAD